MLRFEDSWPFKEGRCSYQEVGHKTLLTKALSGEHSRMLGSKQAPTGSTCQNMIRAFPMDWIPQDWIIPPPLPQWPDMSGWSNLYISPITNGIDFFHFQANLQRPNAKRRKCKRPWKNSSARRRWRNGEYLTRRYKNVALPNLSETKHLRGLFSFEIRPNNFMWLVTRQFACSIKLPKGYSSSEPWGQNAAKGSELSRIEKQSECIWTIPFFCSWGSRIVVLPNRYTLQATFCQSSQWLHNSYLIWTWHCIQTLAGKSHNFSRTVLSFNDLLYLYLMRNQWKWSTEPK